MFSPRKVIRNSKGEGGLKIQHGVGSGGRGVEANKQILMKVVWNFSKTTQDIYALYVYFQTVCKIYHLTFSVIDASLCTITNHSNEETKMTHTPA